MSAFWFENEAIIEAIYPLEASVGDELKPEWLEDFCDYADSSSKGVFEAIPAFKKLLAGDNLPAVDDVFEAMSWPPVKGFIAQVRWCRRQYQTGTMFASGPGLTAFQWIYAETLEDVFSKAEKIVSEDHEKQRAKAA